MKTTYAPRLHRLPPYAATDPTGGSRRHRAALATPNPGFETALVSLLQGWLKYADAYAQCYDGPVGADGVLGHPWGQMGSIPRVFLNGDLERLDGATLDAILTDALYNQGFNPDEF